MIKVEIKNLKGDVTHMGVFPLREEAERWVKQEQSNRSWGDNPIIEFLEISEEKDSAWKRFKKAWTR